jgi:hypothetical protein
MPDLCLIYSTFLRIETNLKNVHMERDELENGIRINIANEIYTSMIRHQITTILTEDKFI